MSESPKPSAGADVEDSLGQVLDEFCQERASGRDPDPEALLNAHPELASELSDCLAGLAAMEELQRLVQPADKESAAPPKVLGDYELLKEIGHGGMGVVCKARQRSLDRLTALKMIHGAEFAASTDLQRFRNEAAIVASLDHPNIVPIYEVGEEQGRLFYSMKLVEGGSLVDWIRKGSEARNTWTPKQQRQFQGAAARLMVQVAKAVRHAHQRGILHRDLKPANILLHMERNQNHSKTSADCIEALRTAVPMVTDFGLAKRIEADGELTQSGAMIGTPSYMAPEQTDGTVGVTTVTDVYGLGGILYALLTGKPPCRGATLLETLKTVRETDPSTPSLNESWIDRDLETICLKCLRKAPKDRYDSVLGFITDLENWLAGKPIRARRVSQIERTWRWSKRHPLLVGVAVMVCVLLLAGTFKAVSISSSRAERLEQEVLRSNVYAARGVASTILWQLERLSAPLARTAESRKLRALLQAGDLAGVQAFLDNIHRKHAEPVHGWLRPGETPPFSSWFVLNDDGRMAAIAPLPKDETIVGRDFSGRDYFQGALRHAKDSGRASVHISRVYHAVNLQLHKFAISAPIRDTTDPNSPVIGVIVVTLTTTSTLGAHQLNDNRHTVVLVGRRDTKSPAGPPANEDLAEHVILLHPAYDRGDDPLPIRNERLNALSRRRPGVEFRLPEAGQNSKPSVAMDANYQDPISERDAKYAGRWLAGFAPVGNTELVVVVQQRYEDVIDVDRGLLMDLFMWSGVALVVGLMCMGLLLGYGMRSFGRTS